MSDIHLLIPSFKVAWSVTIGLLLSVSFSNSIGLASVLVAAVVVVAGGILTLRNNLKTFWKELAEERGAQVIVLEKELHEKLIEMAAFAEEQRQARHVLKTELATQHAQLEIEKSKHDLSEVNARLDLIIQRLDGLDALNVLSGESSRPAS